MKTHSVQEIVGNNEVEIRVDTRIRTEAKISSNRPDIFVFDKMKNEITLIEVGITCQDLLQSVESEKERKYDELANEIKSIYKVDSVRIIPIVLTWEGVVTKYHKNYLKKLGVTQSIQAYIQFRTLKKTLESISFDSRRRREEDVATDNVAAEVKTVCLEQSVSVITA